MNTKESLIAFKSILSLANKSLFSSRKKLVSALFIPLSLIILLADATYQLDITNSQFKLWGKLFKLPFEVVITTIIAVVVHRIILLGPNSVSKWGIVVWTKRETRFLSRFIGAYAIFGAMLFFLYVVKIGTLHIGLIVAVIVGYYLLSRWSLVFPGTAVDRPLTFAESWELTGHHKLLISLVAFVLPITFIALSMALFIPVFMYVYNGLFRSVIIDLIKMGYTIYLFSVLTMAYKFILEQQMPINPSFAKTEQRTPINNRGKLFIPIFFLALIVYLVEINKLNNSQDTTFKAETFHSTLFIKDEKTGSNTAGNSVIDKQSDPQIDRSIESFNKNLADANKSGNEKGAAVYNLTLGMLYANKGERAKAFEHYNKALATFEKHNSSLGIASTFSEVASHYGNWGQLDKSLEYYEKALSIYENLKDKKDMAIH